MFEASGSAGKIVVFAVRLDTFPSSNSKQVYFIGTNNTAKTSNKPQSKLNPWYLIANGILFELEIISSAERPTE